MEVGFKKVMNPQFCWPYEGIEFGFSMGAVEVEEKQSPTGCRFVKPCKPRGSTIIQLFFGLTLILEGEALLPEDFILFYFFLL
jgi:hypothetical protein